MLRRNRSESWKKSWPKKNKRRKRQQPKQKKRESKLRRLQQSLKEFVSNRKLPLQKLKGLESIRRLQLKLRE